MEFQQGITATLRFPPPDSDPVGFDAAPKVTVTDDSATTLLSAVTSTADGAFFTAPLPGANPGTDWLTIDWSGKVDGEDSIVSASAEIVGGYVCSLASIENKLSEARDTGELQAARESASQEVEELCGLAFRERYVRELLGSRGSERLALPRRRVQRIVSLDGDTNPAGLTLDPVGIVSREGAGPEGKNNIDLAYVHGAPLSAAVAPVRDYAAWLLTEAPADWQGRATSFTNEFGVTYAVVTPGVREAQTPIPSVNAFISRYAQVLV